MVNYFRISERCTVNMLYSFGKCNGGKCIYSLEITFNQNVFLKNYSPLHVIHIYNRYTELRIQCTFDCKCPVVKDSDDLFASAQYPSPYVLYNIIQAVYKIPGTIESVLWES